MILCDSGDRYQGTYYNDTWLADNGFAIGAAVQEIAACAESGRELPWTLERVEPQGIRQT